MTEELLDPAYARELEVLRRRLRVKARSGGPGEHLARRRGGSAEFLEHRPYAPGDDLRRIDWLAFARTGEPMFKLFRSEEDIVVRLVLDASASLEGESPSKLDVLKRIAASIGYMALAESERAQIITARTGSDAFGAPTRGRAALGKVLADLDDISAEGGTDLTTSIDTVIRRSARPGMLVILSDFLDSGPFDRAVVRAAAAGHDIALIQALSPFELDPDIEGDLAFEDAETGDIVELTLDDRAIDAYRARLEGLFRLLRRTAKRTSGTYVRTTTTEPTISAVRRFVARTVD